MKKKLELTLKIAKAKFGSQKFTTSQLHDFLKADDSNIVLSTVRWRLSSLKSLGKIEAVARGTYRLSDREQFGKHLSPELYKIAKELQKEFPYADFCIWSTDLLNEFMVHQPSVSFIIIEVEKDALESVFSFLQTGHKNIFLSPTKKEIDLYLLSKGRSVILKSLIKRSPIKFDAEKLSPMPRLEKILVDITSEPNLFSLYQGSELESIWKEAFHKYAINYSSLQTYAKRRNVLDTIEKVVKKLNLLTQEKELPHDSI